MNKGYSNLFPSLKATTFAALIFALATVIIVIPFWWLTVSFFVITLIVFFLDNNLFARECSVQAMLLYSVAILVRFIIFAVFARIPLIGIFFVVLGWTVLAILSLIALISAISAVNGSRFNIPFASKFINTLVEKLGVY